MSQVDKMHFMSTFFWVLVLFILWYCIIIWKIITYYYLTLRSRFLYEKFLWSKIKKSQYYINFLDKIFNLWIFNIILIFKIACAQLSFKQQVKIYLITYKKKYAFTRVCKMIFVRARRFDFLQREYIYEDEYGNKINDIVKKVPAPDIILDKNKESGRKYFYKNFLKKIIGLYNVEETEQDFEIENINKKKMYRLNIKKFYTETNDIDNMGFVFKVSDDIVYARGLLRVQMSEMVKFEVEDGENLFGIVNYLDNEGVVGITVLGDASNITAQTIVERTYKQPKIGTGYNVLGRVINSIGEAIDGNELIQYDIESNIEKKAPGIIERKPVREPLETGIKFIDSMIPIGCGQRELIIGDKKTGKTAIAIDTIINQIGNDIVCIYVSIGQKKSSVAKVYKVLKDKNCMDYTVIVVSGASDSAALQYIAPYSGCAIGEYFRDANRKVVIIYDDLSKHAVAYRQMSLLLRRPPGREGYPGDVFYIHSRLLERAAKLREVEDSDSGLLYEGGSLTALPIIETIQGDVSAYIPTNVISITDGQIFLEASLFNQGIRPAINPGISVSRVGSSAQNKVIKKLAGSLKLELAQFREMEEFARLGLSLDETSINLLEKGRRLVQLLNQPHSNPVNMICQLFLLFGGLNGFFSDVALDWISIFEKKLLFILNDSNIFLILNVIGRDEMLEELVIFIINIIKIYLSNEESIY